MSSLAQTGIRIKIDADTQNAIRNLEQFIGKVTGLNGLLEGMGALAIQAFSVHAMTRWVGAAAEAADAMGKLAQKTGIAVGQLSALSYAAKLGNVEAGEFAVGLKTLAIRADDANLKGGAAAESFRRIGVAFQDAEGKTRPAADLLGDVAEVFSTMEDGAQKTALAVDLFGRSGTSLIPMLNGGPGELEKFAAEARALGVEITPQLAASSERYNDNLTRLHAGWRGFANDLAGEALPRLSQIQEAILNLIKNLREMPGVLKAVEQAVIALTLALTALALRAAAIKGIGLAGGFLMGLGDVKNLRDVLAVFNLLPFQVINTAEKIGLLKRAVAGLVSVVAFLGAGMAGWAVGEWLAGLDATFGGMTFKISTWMQLTAIEIMRTWARIKHGLGIISDDELTDAEQNLNQSAAAIAAAADAKKAEMEERNPKLLPDYDPEAQAKADAARKAAQEMQELWRKHSESVAALLDAQAAGQLQKDQADRELQLKQLEDSLAKEQITLAQYLDRKDALLTAGARQIVDHTGDVLDRLQIQLAKINAEQPEGDQAALERRIRANEIEAKLATLQAGQRLAEKKLAADLFALQQEGAEKQRAATVKEIEQKQQSLALTRDQASAERAAIEADFHLTEVEKRQKVIESLLKEKQAVDELIVSLREKQRLSDPQTAAALEPVITTLSGDSRSLGGSVATQQGQPDPNSFLDQWSSVLTSLREQWGTWAQQTAQSFASVFNNAISSISNGITGLILRTKTWGQALSEIGLSILTSVVQAIVQMGVRWIATRILMATVGKSIEAASLAATGAIAAGHSAIWAAPATLATIATYGGAAMAAPGLIAGAEAITFAQSVAAFAEGGRPEIGQLALVGERGPELFVPDTAGTIIPAGITSQIINGRGGAAAVQGGGSERQERLVVLVDDITVAMDKYRDQTYLNTMIDARLERRGL